MRNIRTSLHHQDGASRLRLEDLLFINVQAHFTEWVQTEALWLG